MLKADVDCLYEDLQGFLELAPKKSVFFITGNVNSKVGNQKMHGVTGKSGLGVQNVAK